MTSQRIAEIYAEQDAKVAEAMSRAHPRLAELINMAEAVHLLALGLALGRLLNARNRTAIIRNAGYLEGLASGICSVPAVNPWSSAEWEDLNEHIQLTESTALLQLVED